MTLTVREPRVFHAVGLLFHLRDLSTVTPRSDVAARACDVSVDVTEDRWCDAPGVTLFTSGGLAAPQRTVRVSARRFAPCEFRSTRGPRRSPAPFHPRPASLTRSFALPLRRSLASLYALTPASRSRARRRVSHAASSTLFPANPLPGVSLASSRDNLAPRAPVWPAASRHPPPRERNPKSSRLVRWHRSRRGRNSAHHARFTRLARLTPSSPSSSRSGVSPRRRRRPLPRARVAVSPRLPHLVRFERVVAFRVASTAHSRSSRSPTMCPSSAATPPLFEVCCHLVR